MTTYEANELDETLDALKHNLAAINHELFGIAADIRIAYEHVARDRRATSDAQSHAANLKREARELRSRTAVLGR